MLTLYGHPISSYTWKVLAALYENGTPFEPHAVDLADPAAAAAHNALWPVGKIPVLADSARHFGLSPEFSFDAHFSRDRGHLVGERAQRVGHAVYRFGEGRHFSFRREHKLLA